MEFNAESKFQGGFSLVGKVAKINKVVGSSLPQLGIEPSKDKFTLNPLAIALMGIEQETKFDKDGNPFQAGGQVVFVDAGCKVMPVVTENGVIFNPDEAGNRFFITKGYTVGNTDFGREIGRFGVFSQVGVWGAMLLHGLGTDQPATGIDDLLTAGIIQKHPTTNAKYISSKKGTAYVKPLTTAEGVAVGPVEIDKGVTQEIFALTDITIIEHKSSVLEEDDSEVVSN